MRVSEKRSQAEEGEGRINEGEGEEAGQGDRRAEKNEV